jgi:trehalose synthase-fused probable maltokinase
MPSEGSPVTARRRGDAPTRDPEPSASEALTVRVAAALRDALSGQRWFGSKNRDVSLVTPADHVAIPGTTGLLALFDVVFNDQGRERYCIPVAPPGASQEPFADAMADPAFGLALLETIRNGGTLAGTHGTFRFTATPVLAEILPTAPHESRPIAGEQSNTSIVYDHRGILKLFRRLQSGPSPELELRDFLTRQAAFAGAPRLAGSVAYQGEGAEPVTLAVLDEFVPNQGDAWTATLERLAEYYAAAIEGRGEESPDPVFARALASADAHEAARLGVLTGRLHRALASAPPGHALAPEPIIAGDAAVWVEAMLAQLGRATQALADGLPGLPPALRGPAARVAAEGARLGDALRAVETLAAADVVKIRVHGDYHLGQLLRTADGFTILDFEGEPARTLAERQAKQCVLKDVAGMLRSYAYAAQIALGRRLETSPHEARLEERLRPWADTWEEGMRAAFLEAYLGEVGGAGGPALVPRERERFDRALHAYELDKALYELGYELANRPAWVSVPVAALERAIARLPGPAAGRLQPGEGPFAFTACMELKEFVGLRAENERQLAQLLDEVPLDSIYYHTHGFLLRHRLATGPYPNDFATWVDVQVRDRILGERLAMVDPADFTSLQAIREELVSVVDEHLRRLGIVPQVVSGEPFDFIQSRIIEVPTGIEARTLPELRDALLEIDQSALYFHLVEARLRLGRGRNDFAAWLERGLGLPELAARVQVVNPYAAGLEQARARLIALLDEALAAGAGR